jgi:hypothetical protein
VTRLVPVAVIGLAIALLVGCGDDGTAGSSPTSGPSDTTTSRSTTSVPMTEGPVPQPLPGGDLEVLVVGDSVMFDATAAIQAALGATGAATTRAESAFGLGFSDGAAVPFADVADEILEGDPAEQVVVMVGSWDHLTAQRDPETYGATVHDALTTLAGDGRSVLVLGEPPSDPAKGEESTRAVVNQTLEAEAATIAGVTYLPTDEVIGDADGQYVLRDDRGALLRKPDGRHLCPEGAERFGAAVVAALGEEWALPRPDPRWVDGPWRRDRRYDDPPGGCAAA